MKKLNKRNFEISKSRFIKRFYLSLLTMGITFFLSIILIAMYPDETPPPDFVLTILFLLLIVVPIFLLLPTNFSNNLAEKVFSFSNTNSNKYVLDSTNSSSFDKAVHTSLENNNSNDINAIDLHNFSDDPLFIEAVKLAVNEKITSTSIIQRTFNIGYNRASLLIDQMEELDIISNSRGSRPRTVHWTEDTLKSIIYKNNFKKITFENNKMKPYSDIFSENELISISLDDNILQDDEYLEDVINYVLNLETFDISLFQEHFNFDFIKTSSYLNTLKKIKVIDDSFEKTSIFNNFNEINKLIIFCLTNNKDIITERKLDSLADGYEFESFIAKLLNENGFDDAIVTKGSNDYGVDVIAEKDGIIFAIQCKYYSSTVGNSAVQEIVSGKAHHNAHIGVVATNNYFTQQAKNLAKTNNIVLWDRDYIIELIKRTQ